MLVALISQERQRKAARHIRNGAPEAEIPCGGSPFCFLGNCSGAVGEGEMSFQGSSKDGWLGLGLHPLMLPGGR